MAVELKDLRRMDFAGNAVQYAGVSSEVGSAADLPTTGVTDFSTYYTIDTKATYMFYKGTWHLQ